MPSGTASEAIKLALANAKSGPNVTITVVGKIAQYVCSGGVHAISN